MVSTETQGVVESSGVILAFADVVVEEYA